MPRKPPKLREDAAETAYRVFQEAVGKRPKTLPPGKRTERNPEAVKRGRKGGKRGGVARAARLSAKRRSLISKRAARERWKGKQGR